MGKRRGHELTSEPPILGTRIIGTMIMLPSQTSDDVLEAGENHRFCKETEAQEESFILTGM